MQDSPSALAVSPVHHLPIITAYADQLGLVSRINHVVPPEMEVDGGTVVFGLGVETRSGRSPLSRLEEVFAHQDTELLVGTALPPHAFPADTVGRVLDRLAARGTMQSCTACAVRAATQLGLERRYGHFDTTSCRVGGDDACAQTQDVPGRVTSGERQEKRPDLQPFVRSMLWVDRAVPRWGQARRWQGRRQDPPHDALSRDRAGARTPRRRPWGLHLSGSRRAGHRGPSQSAEAYVVHQPLPGHLERM